MFKVRFAALAIFLAGALVGYFVYTVSVDPADRFGFKLGLDLAGGTHLVYEADTAHVGSEDVESSMNALRDVIERRVNLFGVAEPLVQVEQSSIVAGEQSDRLIVELPGVTDVDEAVRQIGQTPLLEFKLEHQAGRTDEEQAALLGAFESLMSRKFSGEPIDFSAVDFLQGEQALFLPTELTGKYLNRSQLVFGNAGSGQIPNEPIVQLEFTAEGAELFAELTGGNVGKRIAIYLDGAPISAPVVQEAIPGGTAVISGGFNPEEARALVQNLNFGALPVPIELVSTQTIGPSLGQIAVERGIFSSLVGIALVALFMILWYRLPGLIAVVALSVYLALMLAAFILIPVTLTAAGIAGLILSVGMAVDANILIFARMKEELAQGKNTTAAVRQGFERAWTSIRDGNLSTILMAVILFWFGTSLVQGFALTLSIGVILSMLTAILVSRVFLLALGRYEYKSSARFLYGNGLGK